MVILGGLCPEILFRYWFVFVKEVIGGHPKIHHGLRGEGANDYVTIVLSVTMVGRGSKIGQISVTSFMENPSEIKVRKVLA